MTNTDANLERFTAVADLLEAVAPLLAGEHPCTVLTALGVCIGAALRSAPADIRLPLLTNFINALLADIADEADDDERAVN